VLDLIANDTVSPFHFTMPFQKTGSRLAGRDDTVFEYGLVCFGAGVVVSKRLDHGSQAVMTQFYSLVCFVLRSGRLIMGEPFHHFTFPPFHLKTPFHGYHKRMPDYK
jgi:hypothetical protein